MKNDEAIELAKRAIAPCRGATLRALQIVIAMAERYNDDLVAEKAAENYRHTSESVNTL